MNIADAIKSVELFDLLALLFLIVMFVLGYVQGTIRRLLGIASILFSFLLASQLRAPVGGFLAKNWTQFVPDYSYFIAYLVVFVVASAAFTLVLQGFYKHTPLFERYRFVDEAIGAVLGLIQAALVIGCVVVIFDSFYRQQGIAPDSDELKFLRDFFNFYDPSGTASVFRTSLIPAFLVVFGFMIPQAIQDFFPRR